MNTKKEQDSRQKNSQKIGGSQDISNETSEDAKQAEGKQPDLRNKRLSKSLEDNIKLFCSIFKNDATFILRTFENRYLPAAKCAIFYFDGMINTEVINENIIQPILRSDLRNCIDDQNLLDELQNKVIVANQIKKFNDLQEIVLEVIYGDTLFLVEGYDEALIIYSKGWQTRAITEPEASKVVRGPREGFTESIMINLSLVRRKLKNPNLSIEFMEIGTQSKTKIGLCYIEGIALEQILTELKKRLKSIEIDAVLDSGYLQELIRDNPFSPFETVGNTERPDIAAGKILEGRIAIFVDGSPFVLTVPYIMAESAQANEDYYNNFIFASFNRLIRNISVILSVSIPAVYLALVTYH
ncbi:MAG: spore germination protein, partial [Clostridia bacterium]|nr:spore germination protein [Clostridia bacterium]